MTGQRVVGRVRVQREREPRVGVAQPRGVVAVRDVAGPVEGPSATGVLDDLHAAAGFLARVQEKTGVRMVFIVTDDDLAFQMVCRELPRSFRHVRLYESYLQNFEINSGRFA